MCAYSWAIWSVETYSHEPSREGSGNPDFQKCFIQISMPNRLVCQLEFRMSTSGSGGGGGRGKSEGIDSGCSTLKYKGSAIHFKARILIFQKQKKNSILTSLSIDIIFQIFLALQ